MTLSVRRPALVVALALALAGPSAAAAADSRPSVHSSDGRRGPSAYAAAPAQRVVPEQPRAWQIAAGLDYREWTVALPQGGVRLYLLTADLATPGLSVDQVSGARVTDRAPLSRLVAADGATAGVNADFFDIDDTGAPLGVGRDRERGLLHGPRTGWTSALTVDQSGVPRVGSAAVTGEIRSRGARVARLAGVNTPYLRPGEVGLYTPDWGRRPGRRVADPGARLRQVVVVDGVVRSTTTRPPQGGPVTGQLLLGRGPGADALRRLRVGQRVAVSTGLAPASARVAVGGSAQLLRAGRVVAPGSQQLHPRTAVGYDRDAGRLLLLVADGRSPTSAGLTLRQTASRLAALGADDALNLDGGGSSTMVAPDATGVVGVRNRPSDGQERPVPNGLALTAAG